MGVHPVNHIKIQLDLKKKTFFYFNFFKKIIQKNKSILIYLTRDPRLEPCSAMLKWQNIQAW